MPPVAALADLFPGELFSVLYDFLDWMERRTLYRLAGFSLRQKVEY